MFNIKELKAIKDSLTELTIKKAKLEGEIESLRKEYELSLKELNLDSKISLEELTEKLQKLKKELEDLNNECTSLFK